MKKSVKLAFSAVVILSLANSLQAFEPKKPTCLAPAKPGEGFDLTCKIAANSFAATHLLNKPMIVNFIPGGVGAVAYNHVIGQKPNDGDVIVAFNSGSALNIAQGKFGKYNENAVKWLAGIGADYGAIVVRSDSKWQNFKDMLEDLKKDPKGFAIGSGGSVGSQDWFKSILIAKTAGINPQDMKYVAFEGREESLTALLGGRIQIYSGGISELSGQLDSGKYRVLAVLSDQRLDGKFKDIQTAKEQGYDVVWSTWRGYYMGPKVSNAQYNFWVEKLKELSQTDEFKKERDLGGLQPFTMIGSEFDHFVKSEVAKFRNMAREAGLAK
ncbi:tripartite tricarboxylate transporter substrate binding protein [Campylobacter fetus]|uniref:Tripartite tricarboxylate transport protein TctABC, extracytoplasmic tricarboxylate-binding receptor TctC n=4 Tax=Campylobacter fetus TaxID=196 RepID=A0AAE6M9N4_CAMFE|nr:tripartite tricarboxylate transporter substrate binding protein [Campylobacter fetus]OCS25613.1 tricarboxylic transporter [Campylobacter fetus subsp. venerealis cfvB10]OCS30675.1 tricarboxylic transporter [Campylobacter fetus subsp. venerealis LMG 6570 = CCUG 33900]OCS41440.1 tricarboxylic transporter [Campylobacter fetus subsp. venerealis cfvi02/298]ABK82630.1 tricarboxylic transport [Campylobacter fetus subsp. fetus 82-40]AIR80590.1 putative tripartite tricarboxylate transport protein Tct